MGTVTERLRNVPWVPMVATVASLGVLVVAWITARGDARDIPDAILNAVGLLLTALVFVLALAQARLHRTADAAVDEARQLEDSLLAAHAEHPDAVTTMDLWARAGAMKDALFDSDDWSARDKRLVLERARKPVGNWGPDGALDRSFARSSIRNRLEGKGPESGALSPRRRRALEADLSRLEREEARVRVADDRAGVTGHGYRRLRARVQVAELAARSLVSMARTFSMLMLGLVVLGLIHAGWGPGEPPPLQLWPALVLIALAWVYSRVVINDINLEVSAVASALRDLTLLTLYDAEVTLGHYWEQSAPDGDAALTVALRDHLGDVVDHAGQRAPASHWLAGLRGRFELVEALRAARARVGEDWAQAHDQRMRAEILEHLPAATRLLRYAAARHDDPGAALALARALELHADLLDDVTFAAAPDHLEGADPVRLRAEAASQVGRALVLLRHVPLFGRGIFDRPHRGWFTSQSYLWPDDEEALRELKSSLLIVEDAEDAEDAEDVEGDAAGETG